MILQSLYWGPHKNRLQTINCCTNAEGKHGMTDGGMGTYFSARLIQSPDTPPGSGSKTPSPRWRSARWNRLVHTDHTLGSGTCGCGTAARREPPSQVITPPDSTPDEPVCVSIYCVCSWNRNDPLFLDASAAWHTHTHTHTLSRRPSFLCCCSCVPVQQGASNLPASPSVCLSVSHNLCITKLSLLQDICIRPPPWRPQTNTYNLLWGSDSTLLPPSTPSHCTVAEHVLF